MKKILSLGVGSILLLFVLMGGACQKEEETVPWWKDYEHLTYILEDDRSLAKEIYIKEPYGYTITLDYIYQEDGKPESEKENLIPEVKCLYKGAEMDIFTYVYGLEVLIFDIWEPTYVVKLPGKYTLSLWIYLEEDKENYWYSTPINRIGLDINVIRVD